jgi:hypothetical protein
VIKLKYHVAGADKDLVLASANLPYDSPNPLPTEELEWLKRFELKDNYWSGCKH